MVDFGQALLIALLTGLLTRVDATKINLPFGLPPINLLDRPLIRVNGRKPADRSISDIDRSTAKSDDQVTVPREPIAEVNLPFHKMRLPFSRTIRPEMDKRDDEFPKISATEEEKMKGNLGRKLEIGPKSTLPFPNKLELPLSVMHMPYNQFQLPMSKLLLPLSHIGSGTGLGSLFPGGMPTQRSLPGAKSNSIDIFGLVRNLTAEFGGPKLPALSTKVEKLGSDAPKLPDVKPDSRKTQHDVSELTKKGGKSRSEPPNLAYPKSGLSPIKSHDPQDRAYDTVQKKMQGFGRRMSEFSTPYAFLNLPFSYMNFPFAYFNFPFQGLRLPFVGLNTPICMVTTPFSELMHNFPSFRGAEPKLTDRVRTEKSRSTSSGGKVPKFDVEKIYKKLLKLPEKQGKEERFLTLRKVLDDALVGKTNRNLTLPKIHSDVLKPLFRSIGVPNIPFGQFGTPLSFVEMPLSLLLLPFNFLDTPLSYVNLPFTHFTLPFSFMSPPFNVPLTSLDDIRVLKPKAESDKSAETQKSEPITDVADIPPSLLEALNPDDPLRSYLNLPMSEMNFPFGVFDLPFQLLATPLAHLNLPLYQVQPPFTHLHLPFEYSTLPLPHLKEIDHRLKFKKSKL